MTEPLRAKLHAVDAPTAIAAAAFLMSLNQLIVNVQPIVLGALADAYTLTDAELGHVSAVFVGSTAIATATGPFWVRSANWRILSYLLVFGSGLAYLAGSQVRDIAAVMAFFGVVGLLKGGLSAVSFASLGDASNPDRSYAISTIAQAILAAAVTVPLTSWIIPAYGVVGLFVCLAAIVFTGLLVCHWMPKRGRELDVSERPEGGSRFGAKMLSLAAIPPLLAIFALTLFIGGILGYWYFVERIGTARGVSADFIGIVLSATALVSLGASCIVAWLGGRVNSFVFVFAGSLLLLGGYALLSAPGELVYLAATLLFGTGWGMAQPAYWAVLRKVDATGKLFVASALASGLAGVAIGMAAGPVIEAGGYPGLVAFSGALIILGMLVLALALKVSARTRGV